MSAVTPKVFSFSLDQDTQPVAVRHFQANPCVWRCALPPGKDFANALRVVGELMPLEGAATALASTEVTAPGAVGSVDIAFTAAQLNQPVPRGARTLWMNVTATYPGDVVITFLVGQMLLVKHHFSGTAPAPPDPALYAVQDDLEALEDRVQTLEESPGGGGGLILGETSVTAYRGDRGKAAYDHTALTDNPHAVTKAQVGLGNCDNTSDLAKPISTATQAALDAKATAAALTAEIAAREAAVSELALVKADADEIPAILDDLALKAPLDSPPLTGTPTAPTQASGNNSTRLATTAFVAAAVTAAIDAVVAGAPSAVNTLLELAAAMDNDPAFATTVTNAIAAKLAKASNLADLTDASAALTNLGLTANGKSLVTAANFAAMRTLLALAAGDVTGLSGTVADDIQALAEADNGLEALINARLVAANNLSDLTNAATARGSLGLGTAATGTIGTTAGNVVALDGAAKLPAVDGSQLTNLPGGATRVKLTSAFTTTSGSAQVTGLKFTVGANKNYHVRGVLKIKTDTATVAPRLGINWPTGTTAPVAKIEEPATSSTNVMRYWGPTSTTANQNTGLPDATNFYYAEVVAVFSTDGTGAGDFEITLQSETAGTSVHLGADSFLKYSDY